jgi:hypothetical protein
MTTGETVLERLWETSNPDVDAVNALDTETPVLVNGAWLLSAARDIVLEDAEAASAKLVLGTLRDDTIRLILLLSATGLLTAELLLSGIDIATADDSVLELGSMLGGVMSIEEVTASGEEEATFLIVEGDTISIVLLPNVLIVLGAIAG